MAGSLSNHIATSLNGHLMRAWLRSIALKVQALILWKKFTLDLGLLLQCLYDTVCVLKNIMTTIILDSLLLTPRQSNLKTLTALFLFKVLKWKVGSSLITFSYQLHNLILGGTGFQSKAAEKVFVQVKG